MAINFDKFAQEGNAYLKQLAQELGHPEEIGQTSILLRAVLHTLRDRITVSESMHVLSQLPMFLKGIYVEGWEHREKPLKINSLEEFKDAVKQEQAKHGERDFNWEQSTDKLITMILDSLNKRYLTEGQLKHITGQMPSEIRELFPLETGNNR
ncbi:DUF2267 domain-containing protein [Negadavirga shengliensis]|uniref:DUF2267 domain-containing protein n=1 Tax=Negadavirga shengliensis TaxID=1389218 RepID=A0ABV9T2T7_9BACT